MEGWKIIMHYVVLIILGILAGSVINMVIYRGERKTPFYKWYIQLFYKKPIYLIPEVLLAMVYILLYKVYGNSIQFLSFCLLASVLAAATIKDISSRIIPDEFIIFGIIVGMFMIFFNTNITILNALMGGIVSGGIFYLIAYITKGAVGIGDAKLFACIGLFVGLQDVLSVMMVSALGSGLVGLIMVILGKAGKKSTMPFAPFAFLGTMMVILFK
jgi:leader peptidase (prepilin peptidase)/N-methyltransferase